MTKRTAVKWAERVSIYYRIVPEYVRGACYLFAYGPDSAAAGLKRVKAAKWLHAFADALESE